MTDTTATPQPTALTVHQASRVLEVAFDDGNSFRIDDGQRGAALAETMISGNVAQMLDQVVAVSRERIDTGSGALPWLRIAGLHFS